MDTGLMRTMEVLRAVTKYGVVGLTALMTAHCHLLWAGRDVMAVHILLCVYALVLGIYLSWQFRLCWVHRLCVMYVVSILMCQVAKRHGLFEWAGIDLQSARLTMTITGVMILVLVIWKGTRKNC